MIVLSLGTGHLLRVITGVGGADIEPNISYVDKVAGTGGFQYDYDGVGDALASITTATTTTLLAGAASTQRAVEGCSLYNNHGSVTETVEIIVEDGTHTSSLVSASLLPGEVLYLNGAGDWVHLDANGAPYVGVGPVATQAEMEAGASNAVVVTPGRQHFHPSACKFWVKTTPGNVNAASYNVTSVADTAAGITVITIATDFSSASWCCLATCESTSDTMTVTNLKFIRIGLSDQAAGTVSIEVHDGTATTAVLEDPTSWQVAGWGDQ